MENTNRESKYTINLIWLILATVVNVPLLLFMCATALFSGTIFDDGYCLATIVAFGMLASAPILILVAIVLSWKWYRSKKRLASFLASICPSVITFALITLGQLPIFSQSCS